MWLGYTPFHMPTSQFPLDNYGYVGQPVWKPDQSRIFYEKASESDMLRIEGSEAIEECSKLQCFQQYL